MTRSHFLVFLPVTALMLVSCVDTQDPAPDARATWPPAYEVAIRDAIDPEPAEISTGLTAITAEHPDLTWQDVDGTAHVLMVSLTADTSYYDGSLGGAYDPGGHYLWVTAVPELRERCSDPGFAGDDLAMRLRQLLGLTPTSGVVAFVELWVPPERLFRPAPDNEITDTTAGLAMPPDTEAWYRQWFNELRSSQYVQSQDPRHDAYPWTQLGYTYDWGDPDTEVGVSEFVVRTHSDLIVESITPVDEYCAPR